MWKQVQLIRIELIEKWKVRHSTYDIGIDSLQVFHCFRDATKRVCHNDKSSAIPFNSRFFCYKMLPVGFVSTSASQHFSSCLHKQQTEQYRATVSKYIYLVQFSVRIYLLFQSFVCSLFANKCYSDSECVHVRRAIRTNIRRCYRNSRYVLALVFLSLLLVLPNVSSPTHTAYMYVFRWTVQNNKAEVFYLATPRTHARVPYDRRSFECCPF